MWFVLCLLLWVQGNDCYIMSLGINNGQEKPSGLSGKYWLKKEIEKRDPIDTDDKYLLVIVTTSTLPSLLESSHHVFLLFVFVFLQCWRSNPAR
jgi:hypothetical protein